jgi:tripartite-type tricarboxylate transporter receptor subunit TctC
MGFVRLKNRFLPLGKNKKGRIIRIRTKGGGLMRFHEKSYEIFAISVVLLAFLVCLPPAASGQTYPDKPITIYCGYEAGATTDLTTRAIAKGAEKQLGVSVVVENKAGGASSVCAALVASKKPDGYTLGVVDCFGSLTARPHLMPPPYKPLEDFTFILQYGRYIGGLCVLSESPIKSIDDFIAYAKAHPGLSYGSAGQLSRGHIAVELFAQCKGLTFKHVPFKGGAPANTALLGKHTDFVAGVGQHVQYVKQGVFRMLMVFSAEKRDPFFPDIPMAKDLGCEDVPPNLYIMIGPKGIPDPVYKKLNEAFKKAVEGPDFQKLLENLTIPHDYKDRHQLEKDLPIQYEWYGNFLKKMGVKK